MKKSKYKYIVLTLFLFAGLVFGADTYSIDPGHTYVGFSVRHMVITDVQGKFDTFSGTFVFDKKNLKNSSIHADIRAGSIDTGNEKRDRHLRSDDFFAAEQFPDITFRSEEIQKTGDGYLARGILTIRGISKKVDLPFKIIGTVADPSGKIRMGIEGGLTVNRHDFGLNWNKTLETGGLVVGSEVNIKLNVELVKQN